MDHWFQLEGGPSPALFLASKGLTCWSPLDPAERGVRVYCSRDAGHDGRHVACVSQRVIAAWPGTHAPSEADVMAS